VKSELRVGRIGSVENLKCRRRSLLRKILCSAWAVSLAATAGLAAGAQQAELPDAPNTQISAPQQEAANPSLGNVHGVVVNVDGAVYEGARVVLVQPGPSAPPPRSVNTDSNGAFAFSDLQPGTFRLSVSANGFATQTLAGAVHAGESYEVKSIVLAMSGATSEVEVTATPVEIAQEELKQEETQRVFGVLPNFYVSYVPNAPPLTRRQKYSLAWKTSIDPVTFLAVGAFAGIEQATNSFSGYGQGAQGYGKRFGAGYADQFTGNMIGGAILPSWWKQDPRYFYKGTGTTRSRTWYAIRSAVMCKGDNGRWQVNYSGIVGGLAAGGISNLYYPASDRNGPGLTFENAAINTAANAVGNLFQEFIVRKLTPHVPDYGSNKP
jgi:hypothetical protein